MEAVEIARDLWVWTGWHERMGAPVGSVYYKTGQDIVLVDPLLPPEDPEGFWKALDRDVLPGDRVHVLLTAPSHTRSTRAVVERYDGARVWAWRAAAAAVEERGVTATDRFEVGDRLPGGIEAYATGKPDELMYVVSEHRALLVGNTVFTGEHGLALSLPEWLPAGITQDALRAALEPVLALDIEVLLVSHGTPVLEGGGDALRKLLAEPPGTPA